MHRSSQWTGSQGTGRQGTGGRWIAVFVLMVSLAVLLGCCGDSPASAPRATAVLVDMDGVRHSLPQAEADYLAALAAATPDADTADHLALDPPYRVIVGDLDLALQSEELILMHAGGTKRWSAPGVLARILAAVGK